MEMKKASKKELYFIALLFAIAITVIAIRRFSASAPKTGETLCAIIYEDNKYHQCLDLENEKYHVIVFPTDKDEVKIEKYRDGSIAFVHSDCPDQVCVHSGKLSREGDMAACLPNGLLIELKRLDISATEVFPNVSDEKIAEITTAEVDGAQNDTTDSAEQSTYDPSVHEKLSTNYTGYFDTVSTLVGKYVNEQQFRDFAEDFRAEAEVLHNLFNAHEEKGKNIYYLNQIMPKNTEENFDHRIIGLLSYSLGELKATNGKVNVGMGAIVEVWNKARMNKIPPTKEELDSIAKTSHLADFESQIDIKQSSIEKKGDFVIDTGAIAKGYALDLIAESMAYKYPNMSVLIALGGSMRAIGAPEQWTIGIQHPRAEGAFASLVLPEGMAISTSGDYERYFDYEGRRYHHIVDPETLYPSEGVLSVTVVSESGALCDTLTTALFLMEPEEGIALAEKLGATALYIMPDLSIIKSDDFPEIQLLEQ